VDKESRLQRVEHVDQEIVLIDFSNLTEVDEALEAVAYCTEQLSDAAPTSQLLLYDLKNCIFTKSTLTEMEKFYAATGHCVIASAVVGAEGMMKFIVDSSAKESPRPVRRFDDRTTAMDWLASQL